MHKSWSQLLLIMLVPPAQAVADNPIFYRVVVFNGVLHSNEPGNSVGQNLAIWPHVSAMAFDFGSAENKPLSARRWSVRLGCRRWATCVAQPGESAQPICRLFFRSRLAQSAPSHLTRTMTDRSWAASSSHQATLSLCRLPRGRTPMPILVASRS